MTKNNVKARRSALYLPCSNKRAMEKAQMLACDAIIFDLEDAVSISQKELARDQLQQALTHLDFGDREKVVRINDLSTSWGFDDVKSLVELPIDGLCIPKLESIEEINQVLALLDKQVNIWANIETPIGVLNVDQIASHEALAVLLLGTNDLAKCMRVENQLNTEAFNYAFGRCIMAARAYHCDVLDGVYNHFKDEKGLESACIKAKDLGFDGKTLIHPNQIPVANRLFSPDTDAVDEAERIISAWKNKASDEGIVVVDGRIIEALHVEHAHRIILLSEQKNN